MVIAIHDIIIATTSKTRPHAAEIYVSAIVG